jgi:pimeloyl-ACP methyl ester carboxylesterase
MDRDFLLVHGAFSNRGVWQRILPALTAAGVEIETLDLPAHTAADNANAGRTTMDDYVAHVVSLLDAALAPVILVGHSMGGMVVSAAAEARPQNVAALVYVCALLPESGISLLDYNGGDTESVLGQYLQIDPERGVVQLPVEGKRAGLLNATTDATAAAIALDYTLAEPLAPFATPITLTKERFGAVRRFYVETTRDLAVGNALQKRMIAAQPCERVLSLDTDHMPMLSMPDALAAALLELRSLV